MVAKSAIWHEADIMLIARNVRLDPKWASDAPTSSFSRSCVLV